MAEELVVLQLDTSHFYFFSPATQGWLEYLRKPKSWSQLIAHGQTLGASPEQLQEFCQDLLQKRILQESESPAVADATALPTAVPRLLRDPGKTLEQLSFTCLP